MHIVKQYKHRILAWVRHSKNKQKEQRSISELRHTIKHGKVSTKMPHSFPPKKKQKTKRTMKPTNSTPKLPSASSTKFQQLKSAAGISPKTSREIKHKKNK